MSICLLQLFILLIELDEEFSASRLVPPGATEQYMCREIDCFKGLTVDS